MKQVTSILLALLLLLGVGVAMGETVAPTQTAVPTDTSITSYTPEELLQQWYQIGAMLRTNGTYPFTALQKGDKGYEVQALQTRLAELGYYTNAIVDNYGAGTYTAMRLFEKANDLKADGKASVEDQIALFNSEAVAYTAKKGSSNASGTSGSSSKESSDATSSATSN